MLQNSMLNIHGLNSWTKPALEDKEIIEPENIFKGWNKYISIDYI